MHSSGHRVDPIDRAEQLFIEHLLVLPGMKRQGDEFVSLLHLFFGLHEELGKGNRVEHDRMIYMRSHL